MWLRLGTIATAAALGLIAGPLAQAPSAESPSSCQSNLVGQLARAVAKRAVTIRWHIYCVPDDDTLSDARVAWGDGSKSAGTIAYRNPDPGSGYRIAVVRATHTYDPARPKSASCKHGAENRRHTYNLRLSYVDGDTGERVKQQGFSVLLCTPRDG